MKKVLSIVLALAMTMSLSLIHIFLAVGRIAVQPVWDGQQFQPVHMMSVTGSFDHRIIDGAYGAQFLRELKLLMENPALMLG